MATYNELNALIDAYINRNGVQAITGQILNGVLKAMVDQLGRGYSIMGAATPATDPGSPDGPESWFASAPGTYTKFDGLEVSPAELALLSYTPATGWEKNVLTDGIREVAATIDGNVGIPSVDTSFQDGVLSFNFHNMKGNPGNPGNDGAAAGFGQINAFVGQNTGNPSVFVASGGPNTAKFLTFTFDGLKGETGVTSVVATVDNTTGTPACSVSLVGQELHLDFTGLKGAQGDTGVSANYPIAIINNLTTDDAASALSAAQGKVLDEKVSQLSLKVDNLSGKYYGVFTSTAVLPDDITEAGYAFVGTEEPFAIYNFDGEEWSDTGAVANAITGEPGVGFASVSTTQDGTLVITLTNGDTITVDLNHNHPQYPKYVLLADEAAYTALTTKETDTLYLIPETSA